MEVRHPEEVEQVKRSGRWQAILAVLVVALGVPLAAQLRSQASTGGAAPSEVRVIRVIHFQKPWRAFCDGDSCGVVILAILKATVPPDMTKPSVVLTKTLDHDVSAGDSGQLAISSGLEKNRLRP